MEKDLNLNFNTEYYCNNDYETFKRHSTNPEKKRKKVNMTGTCTNWVTLANKFSVDSEKSSEKSLIMPKLKLDFEK